MFNSRLCSLVLALLLANPAAASLVGDEVFCDYAFSGGGFSFAGGCSNRPDIYQPGPALVNDLGPINAEFYAGLPFQSTFFNTGLVDIEDNAIVIDPSSIVSGFQGFLTVEISSLDWLGNPGKEIVGTLLSGIDLDGGRIDVTNTADSVTISFISFVSTAQTQARIELITANASVPLPSSLLLLLLGVALMWRLPTSTAAPAATTT